MKGKGGLLVLFALVTAGLYAWLGSGGGRRIPDAGQVHLWVGSVIVAAIITGAAALGRARPGTR